MITDGPNVTKSYYKTIETAVIELTFAIVLYNVAWSRQCS